MNYLIILGIIIIAIGTIITYIGSKKDNDSGQKDVIDRINSFSEELNKAQKDMNSGIKKASIIDELGAEFDSWAIDLKENYPEIKLLYNKSALQLSEKELTLSKQWKPFYLGIFNNLERMINSINKQLLEPNKLVITKNSKFPQSLFRNKEEKHYWILKFNETNFWNVGLLRYNLNQTDISLPSIQILHFKDLDSATSNIKISSDELVLYIYNDLLRCEANGNFRFLDTTNFPTEANELNINEILKAILQYQLIQINSFK